MDEEQKPQTINEEAGLGPEWQPIDAPPIIPGSGAMADGSSKYLQGSLPPQSQHDASFVGTAYKSDRMSNVALMPLGLQGNPSTNAGAQSTAFNIAFPVATQAAATQSAIAVGQALPGAVTGGIVSPATLDNVGDSSGRFGQTASGLSYRPLTNPLTAHDAGTNATVNIAAFTMRTSSKGDISVNSGSITALSYSTQYFISYTDSTLAGGAVTFNAATTKIATLSGSGNFFIGSIFTPAAAAADTVGNNDGGAGNQIGSTGIVSSSIQSGNAGTVAVDSGTCSDSAVNQNPQTETWSNFPSFVPGTSLRGTPTLLQFNWNDSINGSGSGSSVYVKYSLDGGTTFTTVHTHSGSLETTSGSFSLALSPAQNLVNVQVQANATAGLVAGTTVTMRVTNIGVVLNI